MIVDEIFGRGFRKGVQNQADTPDQHGGWLVERNIGPLVARAEIGV